jgi:multisubunit Na+/H+ antiporter MnhE subunit
MTRPQRQWLFLAFEALWWWGACLGIWLLSLSAISDGELIVATLSCLPCGLFAVVARRAMGNAWHVRAIWFRPLLIMPVVILTDTVKVFASVLRRDSGQFVSVPVGGGAGDSVHAHGRRAVATFFVTVTPGSYVVDIEPSDGTALLHVLPGGGPSMEKAATR